MNFWERVFHRSSNNKSISPESNGYIYKCRWIGLPTLRGKRKRKKKERKEGGKKFGQGGGAIKRVCLQIAWIDFDLILEFRCLFGWSDLKLNE